MSLLNQSAFQDTTFVKTVQHNYNQSAPAILDLNVGISGGLSYSNTFCDYTSGVLKVTKDGYYRIFFQSKTSISRDWNFANFAYFRLVAGSNEKIIAGGNSIASVNEFGVTDFNYLDFSTTNIYRNVAGSIQTGSSVGGIKVNGLIYSQITAYLQANDTIYLRYNHSIGSSRVMQLYLDGDIQISKIQ
jgi:hypothetical protein